MASKNPIQLQLRPLYPLMCEVVVINTGPVGKYAYGCSFPKVPGERVCKHHLAQWRKEQNKIEDEK